MLAAFQFIAYFAFILLFCKFLFKVVVLNDFLIYFKCIIWYSDNILSIVCVCVCVCVSE